METNRESLKMAAPSSGTHDWSRRPENDDDEEDDPVDAMIKRTGCLEKHYAVQDCMAEHRDWRKCQTQVADFRKCVAKTPPHDYHQKSKDRHIGEPTKK